MKRQLLMMFILVTIALAGMLHGGYMHHQRAGEVLANQEYINQYPEPMPKVVFDSMARIVLQ
jgi:high-affinity Fe2+/Pb2+ permease